MAIGVREADKKTVAIRRLGSNKQEILALDEAVTRLVQEASTPLAGQSRI